GVGVAVGVAVGVLVGAAVAVGDGVAVGAWVTPQADKMNPREAVPLNLRKSRRLSLRFFILPPLWFQPPNELRLSRSAERAKRAERCRLEPRVGPFRYGRRSIRAV
uniref:hypothetical protein n=1 Tax=Thermogutta sp. TaxID=1962930 RepID=UPI00321FC224